MWEIWIDVDAGKALNKALQWQIFSFCLVGNTGKGSSWHYYGLAERQNIHYKTSLKVLYFIQKFIKKYLWIFNYSFHTHEQNVLSSVLSCGVTWHWAAFCLYQKNCELFLPCDTEFVSRHLWSEKRHLIAFHTIYLVFWICDFLIAEREGTSCFKAKWYNCFPKQTLIYCIQDFQL